ncbi:hypothetical protein DRN32_01535 [Thermococci archaeon]|nr:MAG: hypothetical protein DRN32_01535 [Thermococci archaeon]
MKASELGIKIGTFEHGKKNSISDVKGINVSHVAFLKALPSMAGRRLGIRTSHLYSGMDNVEAFLNSLAESLSKL